MADIRKTFNFRAGVQVDDDVFIVRGEQVGIGTTIPTQSLDVRGNAKVVGILTAQNTDFSAGISTFGDVKIGTGISISASSGIITATAFSGDGSQLQNVPTSSWTQYNQLDDNGLSVVSIAKSTGNVGVATTAASSNNDFQVGSDPQDGFSKGVGIGSDGNIYASGIITATTFSGTLVGTVATVTSTQGNFSDHISVGNTVSIGGTVGLGSHVFLDNGAEAQFGGSPSSPNLRIFNNNVTQIVSSNTAAIVSGNGLQIYGLTYNHIRGDNTQILTSTGTPLLTTNSEEVSLKYSGTEKFKTTNEGVLVTGLSTFTGAIDANGDLDVDGLTNLDDVSVAGVSTFTGNIDANGDLDVDGFTNLDGASIDGNLNVSGVSTFTGSIDANGDLDVDGHTELDNVNVSGVVTATSFIGNITGTVNTAAQPNITSLGTITGLDVNGHSELDNVNVSGVSTFTGAIDANGDLDVDGQTELDNVNVSGLSTFTGAIDANGDLDVDGFTNLDGASIDGNLSVSGLSTFVGDSKFDGLLGIQTADPQTQLHVWDNTSQVARFQSNQTTSIISFVDETSTLTPYIGANSNDLILGSVSGGERLRITGIGGSLGIGKTNPDETLHVVGTSTVTNNAFFGGTVSIVGNTTINANLNVGSLTVPSLNAHIVGNNAKIHSTSGISTVATFKATGISTFFNNVTITDGNSFQVNSGDANFFVSGNGTVGIRTTNLETDVVVAGDTLFKTSVSVGNTGRCSVDFSEVVDIQYNDGTNRSLAAYMLPPIVNTAQRNALVDGRGGGSPINGAIVFNSDAGRLEIRDGANWYGIGTVA